MKLVHPSDNWGDWQPRRWQAEALPIVATHLNGARPENAAVRAVTGAGKSRLMAQIAACAHLEKDEVVVISTPTIQLVESLADTFRERLGDEEFMAQPRVGSYYTHSKDISTPFIVTCIPSLGALAEKLRIHGKRCALWIADELHRTAQKRVQNAYAVLLPDRVLGFTATPYLANENRALTLVDKLIYNYDVKDAIADGDVIVPWRITPWESGQTSLDTACIEMTKDAAGPGIFNAVDINDAINFARVMTERGFQCEAVHSRKMTRGDRKQKIKDLVAGKVRALVHVNLLQEGVDIPEIRWMCLRRPVGSRVRFVQEIGRGLRWCKGKSHITYYDPHGLFEIFKITYAAVIGGDYNEIEEDTPSQQFEKEFSRDAIDVMKYMVGQKSGKPVELDAQQKHPLTSYLMELTTAFDALGVIERYVSSREWRSPPVTAKQIDFLKDLKASALEPLQRRKNPVVPPTHARALSMLADYAPAMKRGEASDLIGILNALHQVKKWPDFKHLDESVNESLVRHEKRKFKPDHRPAGAPAIAMEQGEMFGEKT